MQCFNRKNAWIGPKGLIFDPRKVLPEYRHITVPCGKCDACRLNKSSEWATRVVHEMEYCDECCFLNLTYAVPPPYYSLVKKDLQDFMKRLRINLSRGVDGEHGSIRAFFACGEYGSKKGRPHYHVLILGWKPHDGQFYKTSYAGDPIYTSKFLEKTWGKGFCPYGSCTNRSAGYVARYCKKVVGTRTKRAGEFTLASRNILLDNDAKGAIGAQWLRDHHSELRHGFLKLDCLPDVKLRIPDYYFKLLEKWYPDEYDELKAHRLQMAEEKNLGIFFGYNVPRGTFDLYFDESKTYAQHLQAIVDAFNLDDDLSEDEILEYYRTALQHCKDLQDEKIQKMFERKLDKKMSL